MNVPKPPWYKWAEDRLRGKDDLVNAMLVAIILLTLFIMIKGDNVVKLTWAVYLISP